MATGRIPDPNTAPLTAKGDLYTYSTVPARQAVGSDGDTLVADSAATTGLRWTATPSASNPVLNSSFQVWQRGTSVSVNAATASYTADRWLLSTGANAAHTVSRQSTNDTTNLPSIQYCARIQRNSGQTGANQQGLYNMFETINSISYAGKTVTVSFYARKGADFSPTSSNIIFALYTGTGTDQNLATAGYTGAAAPGSVTASLTTTWTRYSFTTTLATSATELSLFSYWTTVGTAGANDFWEVTGVQMDIGSVALPYRPYSNTLAGELAACQRYYVRFSRGNTFHIASGGIAATANDAYFLVIVPVAMRVIPTSIDYSTLYWQAITGGSGAFTAATISSESSNLGVMVNATGASGLTATTRPYFLQGNGASSYLGLSAEL